MTLPVIEQNLHFLRQGADLLRLLDDKTYTDPGSDRPRAAGVGSHLRHCLDFYHCFLRDLESGRIDYDRRDRSGALESEIDVALKAVEDVMVQLSRIPEEQADRSVEVRHDLAPDDSSSTAWQRSTVGRELRFLASHTVHHYALIAQLVRAQGIEPGEEFGVAPATLEYWHGRATAG